MRTDKTQPYQIVLFILSFFTLNSCQQKYQVEINAIDTLLSKNKLAEEYMQIDLIAINERIIEMSGQVKILDKFKVDTFGGEFILNYDKYKGILKVYQKFIENYDKINAKVRYIDKQLSDLKNSLIDDKITASDYKLALQKETENVESNLTDSEVLGHRIFQLEPDYQKLSRYFDEQVEIITKEFPELKNLP